MIYAYILKKQPTQESWIEWSILATNNVHKFLYEIITHEVFTYFEALAFELLCILACRLWPASLVASNFVFSNSYILCFYAVMSVSHCLNRTLSLSIEDNNVEVGKRKLFLALMFVLSFTVVIIVNVVSGH